MLTRYHSITAF